MNIRTVPPAELSAADLQKWRELAARTASPNPLSEPECVIPAARHLRNGSRIVLVIAEHEGRFVACIPVQKVRRWRSIPRTAYSTRIRRMTWDATPLLDSEHAEAALRAVLEEFANRANSGGPTLLVLEWLNERGPVGKLARRIAGEMEIPWRTYATWEQPFMTRRDDLDERAVHSKKTLATRERKLRGLTKAIGGAARIVDLGNDPSGPLGYVQLEASGYKAAGGVAMTTQAGEREWFLDMAAGFAQDKRFHVLTLEVDGKTVAMECLVRAGEALSMVKWSYDEQFEKFSPGAQLHLSTHAWFHEETDAAWLDVCTFENNHFALGEYPESRSVSTTVFGLRGARDGKWLKTLRFDRALRAVIYKAGERVGLNSATLAELCEGGGYTRLDWRRVK